MKGWKTVKLGSLLTESKIVSENPNTDKRISVRLNIQGVEKRPTTKDKAGATKYYVRKAGQFIYGKQNLHKGAFGIVPKELDGYESSLDIPAFDIDDSCCPEWIFYFFLKGNFYLKLEGIAKGVGSKRIHPKQIFGLDIFLPFKVEQRKVLDEIEKVEINNYELINETDSQEENLSKLLLSILRDAIQGKLTKEWREQNQSVESASELLKSIKAEKEQLVKEKKIKKKKPLPPITQNEIPYDLPKSWVWTRLSKVINSISTGPFGSMLHKRDYVVNGIPVINPQQMVQGEIVPSNKMQVSKETVKRLSRYILHEGDIVIARRGEMGRCAIINKKEEGFLCGTGSFFMDLNYCRPTKIKIG